jgi:hypothetical protein
VTSTVITRRDALRILGTAAAVCGLHRALAAGTIEAAPAWLAGTDGLDALCELGRAYSVGHPNDPGVDEVWRLLEDGTDRSVDLLRHRAAGDYAADRLIALDGWWVSQTEGRIFAGVAKHV